MSKSQILKLSHWLPIQVYRRAHAPFDPAKCAERGTLWGPGDGAAGAEEDKCAQCSCVLVEGASAVVQLPCGPRHFLCASHVSTWILDAHSSPRCPTCRAHMYDWVQAVESGFVGEGTVAEWNIRQAEARRARDLEERNQRAEAARQFIEATERARQQFLRPFERAAPTLVSNSMVFFDEQGNGDNSPTAHEFGEDM